MAIKINGQDLLKRYINGQEIVRVYKNGGQIRPETVPPVFDDYLCFTAETNNSSVALSQESYATNPALMEISYNKSTWMDYTIGTVISLSNIGDKVYFRNKELSLTDYIYAFRFSIGGYVGASGDIGSLLCKNSTTEAPSICYANLFSGCTGLTTPPKLPAITVESQCYTYMFSGCTSLRALPKLPATSLGFDCYTSMFSGCSSIYISETQGGDYQNQYRIPTTGTASASLDPTFDMFYGTGGTFTGTPSLNTTYYTSNQVI